MFTITFLTSGHRNLDTGGHTGFAKDSQFQGAGWQEFVEIKAAHWLNFYKDWLENNPLENILVLHYENIQQNLPCVAKALGIRTNMIHFIADFLFAKLPLSLGLKNIKEGLTALSTSQQVGAWRKCV